MRILFLSVHLGRAGTTTHLVSLATGLRQAGCTVAVASQQRGESQKETAQLLEDQGVRCYQVNFPTVYRSWHENLGRLFTSTFELGRIVREFQPDIIHVQWRSLSWYAQLMKLMRKIPFVTTLNAQSIPSGRLHRALSFWGDCAIAISEDTRKVLIEKFGLKPSKARVILYGCDIEHFRLPSVKERIQARSAFGFGDTEYVASILARLSPEKRHQVAIKALPLLRAKGKDLHLLFAGVPYSNEVTPESLMKLAHEEGVGDLVHILGHSDAQTVLWASDLSILPSSYEGLSSAVIEAMLCGVVPIRTPSGGASDQIQDGVNGFLFPFEDHLALADRIDLLLSDPNRLSTMAEQAFATARQKFSMRTMIDKTISVYANVLSNRGIPVDWWELQNLLKSPDAS